MSDASAFLNLPADPIEGLLTWVSDAEKLGVVEPTAMALATATPDGRPSARIVLFKGEHPVGRDPRRGLKFFTNYESRKSHELQANPHAALVFHWRENQRQLRLEGRVEKLSYEESNAYFQSRARGSRIGAWASPQSQKIESRQVLIDLVEKTEERFANQEVPCPPFWGGWLFVPEVIEFWQEGTARLHDRIRYDWNGTTWERSRLAP